ncbi:MAG: hypothetical protein ACFHWZ_07375 [Phycisphaerales bacterium]
MLTIRKAEERGRTRFDWLDGKHSFSFGAMWTAPTRGSGRCA